MPLKLMYITNRPDVAVIAEESGVDRIFVDMEFIGKTERQGGMNSVQNRHTAEDVAAVRAAISKARLLVRVNPIHEELHRYQPAASLPCIENYPSSREEIEAVIAAGAEILMLPYFKTTEEVVEFLKIVNGRTKTMLLLETAEAVEALDDILELPGIDEIHIGINDLAISYGKKFMFELLADGTVDRICRKLESREIFYGFGGIARLGQGAVPAEMIVKEHYRLGSRMVILSRSFCNVEQVSGLDEVKEIFSKGVKEIRALEEECALRRTFFTENRKEMKDAVAKITEEKGAPKGRL